MDVYIHLQYPQKPIYYPFHKSHPEKKTLSHHHSITLHTLGTNWCKNNNNKKHQANRFSSSFSILPLLFNKQSSSNTFRPPSLRSSKYFTIGTQANLVHRLERWLFNNRTHLIGSHLASSASSTLNNPII